MERKKHTMRREEGCSVHDNKSLPYIIIRPDTKEEWLKQRHYGIGASESGKVLGCSKYGSSYNVFMDKIGFGKVIEENWAMRQGHIFEKVVAEMFQDEIGNNVIGLNQRGNVKADWIACSREHDFLRVSPDYIYWLKDETTGKDLAHNLFNRGILECKTSVHHYEPECLMGECLSWYCQVQYQLHVLQLKEAYLGFLCIDTLTGGDSWFKKIEYNEKFCKETLIPSLVDLWENHISPAKKLIQDGKNEQAMEYCPEITDAENVSSRYPKEEPGKTINGEDIPDFFEKISIYVQNRTTIKELEKVQKEIEGEIKLKMMDAESILGTDQKPIVTYKAAKPSMKFDSDRFKKEQNDIYLQYCNEVPGSRRFLIK